MEPTKYCPDCSYNLSLNWNEKICTRCEGLKTELLHQAEILRLTSLLRECKGEMNKIANPPALSQINPIFSAEYAINYMKKIAVKFLPKLAEFKEKL